MQWLREFEIWIDRGARAAKTIDQALLSLDPNRWRLPPEIDSRLERLARIASRHYGREVSKADILLTIISLAEKACTPKKRPKTKISSSP